MTNYLAFTLWGFEKALENKKDGQKILFDRKRFSPVWGFEKALENKKDGQEILFDRKRFSPVGASMSD